MVVGCPFVFTSLKVTQMVDGCTFIIYQLKDGNWPDIGCKFLSFFSSKRNISLQGNNYDKSSQINSFTNIK